MRLFSSDRIAGVMDKLGFKEGEMIEHSMISKSIEDVYKRQTFGTLFADTFCKQPNSHIR